MTEDAGTTKRKKFSPTHRLKIFEQHKGICALCSRKIHPGEKFIIEHLRALALSGTNDGDNLAPVHVECAAAKTAKEDIPRISKAKRQKLRHLGIEKTGPKIRSAGFARVERERAIDKDQLPALPRRSLYQDV